jgi:5-hydroxyisourate hydrolase-like protein (transthyretin family)
MLSSRRILIVALVVVFCVTGALAQSDKSERDAQSSTGSVSGRITQAGEPATGVTVTVYQHNTRGFSSKALGRSTTDTDGRFRVGSLPSGQLLVSPRALASVAPKDSRGPIAGRIVTLGDGESLENVDINLVPGGVITGRIVDQDNRPVIALQVRAVIPGRDDYDWTSTIRTDDRGIYRIFGLAAGKYQVRAGDEFGAQAGGAVRPYPVTYFPGTADEKQAGLVDVSSGGESRNVDFVVRRSAAGFAAAGRVVNTTTGKPASGVYVMCMPVEPSDIGSFSYAPIVTDTRGEFRVPGLKPGRYRLNAFTSLGRSADTYADAVPFDVVASDVVGLEVRLKTGSRIQGAVVFEGRGPGEGSPDYSSLRVFCFSRPESTDRMDFVPSMPAQVNADGTFTIEGVRPGNAQVGLDVWNGPKGLTLVRIERDGSVVDSTFEVLDGENVTGLKLVATMGNAAIRGRVVPKGGELPTGVSLVATARRPDDKQQFGQRPAPVDSRNQFLIDGLVDGDYEVTVSTFGSETGTGEKRLFASKRVTVTGGQNVDVTIELDVTRTSAEEPK